MRRRPAPRRTRSTGELHLGASSLVAGYILADLLGRFRRAYPGVAVVAFEDIGEYLEHLLVNGELDVAVMVLSRLREAGGARSARSSSSPRSACGCRSAIRSPPAKR